MTIDQKKKLIMDLGRFQNDEWDNLTNDEFRMISDAVMVVTVNLQKECEKV